MKSKDPQLRMALKLQSCLEQRQAAPDDPLHAAIKGALSYARTLDQQLQCHELARRHGWLSAAVLVQEQLTHQLRQLHRSVTDAVNQVHPVSALPQQTLRDLYDELRQLSREFSDVDLDLKAGVVTAVTEDIELKGFYLGPFEIKLHLDRLAKAADSSVFEVTALDPHPAASNSEVTHPHVRDGEVCAGDATVPIASALREGRLVDAFLALNSVLHNYNPHSPFVALDDWEGTECADCGSLIDGDGSYFCLGCERDFCDDCASACDICGDTYCRACLEEDVETGHQCCRECREMCNACRRIVENEDFDRDSGLCPQCLEKQPEEEPNPTEPNNPNPSQEQETNHESNDHQRPDDDGAKSKACGQAATAPTANTAA